MKKRTMILLALLGLCLSAGAQSLMDNSFYQAGSDLSLQAQAAYDSGDYDAAADYAAQAQEYFAKSDEYVAMMIKYQDAQMAITKADERLAWAESIGARRNDPEAMAKADQALSDARAFMADEKYDEAAAAANAALAALAGVNEARPLPASYLVQLLPKDRDCLWKIAGLSWAYNDPWQWKKLYEANKKLLFDPNNPDLILPGQVIKLPSLYGEKREGLYDPKAVYQSLEKPRKK
jgi:nucleoid-associated protein YgaU